MAAWTTACVRATDLDIAPQAYGGIAWQIWAGGQHFRDKLRRAAINNKRELTLRRDARS